MDITERIHNAIEWASKRLTLQGQELSQEQKNYLTFALSQNFTDNYQALQLLQDAVMGSASRIPESFLEYEGEEIMSNFDGAIVSETAEAIKGKELFSIYAGWNFNGKVWWQNNLWNCEVWCYGSFQKTFNAETLDEIMSDVCSEYGHN